MKDILTIIIRTYNRYSELNRIIDYYSSYNFTARICILDSSSYTMPSGLEKKITSAQIEYYRFDPSIPPLQKICLFIENVSINTPYSVIVSEDDFITPNGMQQAVAFLEKNTDYTVAHGDYISFWLLENKSKGMQFCWKNAFSFKSISFSDEIERLDYHFANYSHTVYAVHRTEFLKMILNESLKNTSESRFEELLPSMLTIIYGKLKKLDLLYCARDSSLPTQVPRRDSLFFLMEKEIYKEKYKPFRECLAFHLRKQKKIALDAARQAIDSGMAKYLATVKQKSINANRNLFFRMNTKILKFIKRYEYMNYIFLNIIKPGYLTIPFIKRKYYIDNPPPPEYAEDFYSIRSRVLIANRRIQNT